jgi:hypothetical protein
MSEFLAAPFMLLANLSLWIATLITGNPMILIEVVEDGDDDDDDEENII